MITTKIRLAVALLSTLVVASSAVAGPQYQYRLYSKGVTAAAATNPSGGTPGEVTPAEPVEPVERKAVVSYVESELNFGTIYTNGPAPVKRYLHIQNTGNKVAQDDPDTWEGYQIGAENYQVVSMYSDDPENTCFPDKRNFYLAAGQTCVMPVVVYNVANRTPGMYSTNAVINGRDPEPYSVFAPITAIPITLTVANP